MFKLKMEIFLFVIIIFYNVVIIIFYYILYDEKFFNKFLKYLLY